ncbi:MAG: Holliday junction branch migration protein RuvA [Gemmatimonadetes bacterium]|nr:MAG: Holliday junction branch migration protein RuvA [Gemmatimonadota bacterium]
MITFLRGILVKKAPTQVVLDVNGVGYTIAIPLSSYEALPATDKPVQLLTHLHLRDNDIQLFGFMSSNEKRLFEKVINVSGVGPQLALGILSAMPANTFKQAIFQQDVKALTKIPRVGKKLAERLILELKDSFKNLDMDDLAIPTTNDDKTKIEEAVLALISLGYKEMQSRSAIVKARAALPDEFTVEDLVREGLNAFL